MSCIIEEVATVFGIHTTSLLLNHSCIYLFFRIPWYGAIADHIGHTPYSSRRVLSSLQPPILLPIVKIQCMYIVTSAYFMNM